MASNKTEIPSFPFPVGNSKIVPDPSKFISPHLLLSPLPTNSFCKNFIVNNGDQPCYFHPYLIKLSLSSLSLSYPSISSTSSTICLNFSPDLTISTSHSSPHSVSVFTDLTVTVTFGVYHYFLARGSPYVTLQVSKPTCFSFSTISAIKSITSCKDSNTQHKIELESNRIVVIYSSSRVQLMKEDDSHFSSGSFVGVIRFAILPDKKPKSEEVLGLYSTCYPVKGEAILSDPFCLNYKWETKGWGNLLMLAHPLQLKLLSCYGCGVKVLEGFKYRSIDGDLVGVVGCFWKLRVEPVPITWHSIGGIEECNYSKIVCALRKDVGGLNEESFSTTHNFNCGMKIARAAKLALIAEEVNCVDVMHEIMLFLRNTIEPWLLGSLEGNGFVYEDIWGGIVTKQGLTDKTADYWFGLYNNHHYNLSYYVFTIAVLTKLDPEWGLRFKHHAYALVGSYMSIGVMGNNKFTKVRCFDFYKLHSWVGALEESVDGANSQCPSLSINAYYAASLLGMAYGDAHLITVGSTLASFEIQATQTWWHVREGGDIYDGEFSKKNRMMGIVWENKRENRLWSAPASHKDIVVGCQLMPLLPFTEILYSDVEFVKEIVAWAVLAMSREDASEEWKGDVYALEAIYDPRSALRKIRELVVFSEGNSLSNLLWWVHSQTGKNNSCANGRGENCWFCEYCC